MIRFSEMVLPGHPDKFCDQVADAIVARAAALDVEAYCQVEVGAWCDQLWVSGGFTLPSGASLPLGSVVAEVAARVREIMAGAEGKYLGVRVGVTNGGCAGMSYTMDYAADSKPFEEVVEDKGVKIFIDPKAILFLLGTQMDFQTSKLSSGFVFHNPNQTSACGCGESVAIEPASAGRLGV